jgi:antitoxin HigA-1
MIDLAYLRAEGWVNSDNPVHPGEVLRKIVKESQTELADMLGVTDAMVSLLMRGKRSVTANIALRLEDVGYGSAREWLIIQADHDLARERARLGERSG